MTEVAPSNRTHLLARSPLLLGHHELRNRICFPAHTYGFSTDSSGITDAVAYVSRRLQSGVAMVITGEAEVPFGDVTTRGLAPSRLAGVASERLYNALSEAAAAYGGAVVEQIYHPGGQVWYEERRQAVAPSPVPHSISYIVPRELAIPEIGSLTASFADAAHVAVQSGLHGVEIKADQGKLHHQFLSRRYNKRTDAYGGTGENRARFLMECIEAIRTRIGMAPILGVRLPGWITPPLGDTQLGWASDLSMEECTEAALMLDRSGLVNYVSISGETNSTAWGYARNHGDESVPRMTFREAARMLRRAVRLPILVAGKVMTLDDAEELLNAGDCDLVGMARALIADGDLLSTAWKRGRPDLVRPCISCNIGCVGNTWIGRPIRCVLDPTCGIEALERSHQAKRKSRIAVVGGGPSGLVFAATAAQLGSRVTLFERNTELGGQIKTWSSLPNREEFLSSIGHWERVLRDLSVKIICGKYAPQWDELSAGNDIVVDATGGTLLRSDEIHGVRQFDANSVITANIDWNGVSVIVFDANRYLDALGIALWLRKRGALVRILSPFEYVGIGLDPVTLSNRIGALREAQIECLALCDLVVGPDSVEILDHSRNIVHSDRNTRCVVWCVNPVGPPPQLSGQTRIAIGESAGVLGLEHVIRHAYDQATTLLCGE